MVESIKNVARDVAEVAIATGVEAVLPGAKGPVGEFVQQVAAHAVAEAGVDAAETAAEQTARAFAEARAQTEEVQARRHEKNPLGEALRALYSRRAVVGSDGRILGSVRVDS